MHLQGIFNRSGIVLPCLLLEGQAAGQWKVSGKTCAVTPFRALKARRKKPRSGEVRRWFPAVERVAWEE